MVGGVISDIYHAQDRNGPMSCFSGAALFGTGLGPLISGFIEMRVSWRWIFYSEAIASAIFLVLLLAFLKETRGSVLLSGKARVLNKYYEKLEEAGYYGVVFTAEDSGEKQRVQRIRWKVKSDEERETLVRMISISCYRPFRKLHSGIRMKPVTYETRSLVHRTGGVLLLPLGCIQLGDTLPQLQFYSSCLFDQPWLQCATGWCRVLR